MLPTTRIPLQRLLLVAPLMTAIVPALAQNTHLGGDILLRDGVIRTSSNVSALPE